MTALKKKLEKILPDYREKIKILRKEHGHKVMSEVKVAQAYGGMRGVKALVCDTSNVPPERGLIVRGIPIGQLTDRLPEEVFWLLLTGELPSTRELNALQKDLKNRCEVPHYVWDVLESMAKDSHPMTMFNTAILCMQRESEFSKAYDEGIKKSEYWEHTLEDALNIIAKAPEIAAGVYRMAFKKGKRIPTDHKLDMGANYAQMLGLPDPKGDVRKLIRLYLVLHCDHEGGNASALTCATVNSGLSDLYYSISAGMNSLAGPLHGLANQNCLKWVLMVMDKFNGVPSDEQLKQFTWDTLNSDQVVPGYGHAVLKVTDPRFSAFMKFGREHCYDDPVFITVSKIFDVVPDILTQIKKIRDPWPNVDAASGALLYHYGMKEFPYYTVLFAVSRILGISAQAILARALELPINRPKSVTTEWIENFVTSEGGEDANFS